MQPVVAFQGLGVRDWKSLYRIPEINQAIHSGQEILRSNDIQIEGEPLDIIKACKEGGLILQEHSQTCWQQPCIFLASMAYWKLWRAEYPNSNPLFLGFSFGEWSAATAAGCIDEETGLLAATMRGIFTSSAGGSSLLVRTREEQLPVKRLRLFCKGIGGVWLASFNSPFQGLIAGKTLELNDMAEFLKDHLPQVRTSPYQIGGAFHTPLMKKARKRFAGWLEEHVEFKEPESPMMLNATAEITRNPRRINEMLLRQLTSRLNFRRFSEQLPQDIVLHEICVAEGERVIAHFISKTHAVKYGEEGIRLKAIPFPT